jgi:hypothetical protein
LTKNLISLVLTTGSGSKETQLARNIFSVITVSSMDTTPRFQAVDFLVSIFSMSDLDGTDYGTVWHIDYSVSINKNEAHPKVKLIQADNRDQLLERAGGETVEILIQELPTTVHSALHPYPAASRTQEPIRMFRLQPQGN